MSVLSKGGRIISYNNRVIDNQYTPEFVITINTTLGGALTMTLPLIVGYTYSMGVDWGDGTYTNVYAYNSSAATHTYASHGIYKIKISGTLGAWGFNNSGSKAFITRIDSWGRVLDLAQGTSLTNGFSGCNNLNYICSGPITGKTYPSSVFINNLFNGCTSLTSIPTGLFDLTNYAGFAGIFQGCTSLTSIPNDLFRYNTSSTAMQQIFYGCTALTSLPEDLFYYNNLVTNYSYCFYGTRNIMLPVRVFNLANLSIVTNFSYFMNVTSTAYSHTGTIQDIWNYSTPSNKTNAFTNQINLSNYASIPALWK